jgi:hypothetical protein
MLEEVQESFSTLLMFTNYAATPSQTFNSPWANAPKHILS